MLRTHIKRMVLGVVKRVAAGPDGRVLCPVLRGPAKGLRFRLDFDILSEPAYMLGTYENAEVEKLAEIVRPGWTVWEVGTYIGFYTCVLARLVGPSGRIIAVEPDPRNVEQTRANVTLNGFSNVRYEQRAVGGVDGEIDFVLSDNTNSHIPGVYIGGTPEEYATRERLDGAARVKCSTLDGMLGELPRPDLIKLDIEGAEREALAHAHRLAAEARPLFVIELHNPECDRAAWEFARAVNYDLFSLDENRPLRSAEEVGGTVLCSPQ